MFSRREALVSFAVAAFFLQTTSLQAQTKSPERLIGEWGIELLEMLKLSDRKEREVKFRSLMLKGVDVDLLAIFVLGRYRHDLKPEQRSEYRKLFEDFLVNTYVARLGLFKGEVFTIKGTQKLNQTEVLVQTLVERPSGKPIRLDWRLRNGDRGWQISDVIAEGISMALTQQAEFVALISNNGGRIEALMDRLRSQTP